MTYPELNAQMVTATKDLLEDTLREQYVHPIRVQQHVNYLMLLSLANERVLRDQLAPARNRCGEMIHGEGCGLLKGHEGKHMWGTGD